MDTYTHYIHMEDVFTHYLHLLSTSSVLRWSKVLVFWQNRFIVDHVYVLYQLCVYDISYELVEVD